jgi:hypothetical protein
MKSLSTVSTGGCVRLQRVGVVVARVGGCGVIDGCGEGLIYCGALPDDRGLAGGHLVVGDFSPGGQDVVRPG